MKIRNEGCKCICHSFPQHTKLQDALEANQFHINKMKKLEDTLRYIASLRNFKRAKEPDCPKLTYNELQASLTDAVRMARETLNISMDEEIL